MTNTNLAHAINHTPMSPYQWLIVALAVILYQNNFKNGTKLAIVRRGELQFVLTRPY